MFSLKRCTQRITIIVSGLLASTNSSWTVRKRSVGKIYGSMNLHETCHCNSFWNRNRGENWRIQRSWRRPRGVARRSLAFVLENRLHHSDFAWSHRRASRRVSCQTCRRVPLCWCNRSRFFRAFNSVFAAAISASFNAMFAAFKYVSAILKDRCSARC